MLSLSFSSITAELFAATTLRKVFSADESLTGLLNRDNIPALRMAVGAAFTWLVSAMGDLADDATLDRGRPEKDFSSNEPYTLEVGLGKREELMPRNKLMVVRYHLEHLVAMKVLQGILPEGDSSLDADLDHMLDSLRALLLPYSPSSDDPDDPSGRWLNPCYY